MATIDVKDAAGATVAIEKPLVPGRTAAATSRPVALSNEDKTALDALATQTTAAAILAKIIATPATEAKQDNAITQETAINTVLGVKGDAKSAATDTTAISAVSIWKQISASVQLMVFGAGPAAAAQRTTLASDDPAVATLGAAADAAVTAGATGSISAKLRSISRDIVANIVLAAGSAIIGKVGIDQTTPGTTNAVALISGQAGVAGGAGAVAATVQRVTLASDDPGVVALQAAIPAGSNLIGRAVADANAATGGIATTARLASAAASTNATNVKGSAGRVYSAQGYNAAAYPVYLVLYDSAANPPVPGSTTIRKKIPIPAGAAFALDWPVGMSFSAGIGYAFTKLAADADTTVLVAADVLQFNLDYV